MPWWSSPPPPRPGVHRDAQRAWLVSARQFECLQLAGAGIPPAQHLGPCALAKRVSRPRRTRLASRAATRCASQRGLVEALQRPRFEPVDPGRFGPQPDLGPSPIAPGPSQGANHDGPKRAGAHGGHDRGHLALWDLQRPTLVGLQHPQSACHAKRLQRGFFRFLRGRFEWPRAQPN